MMTTMMGRRIPQAALFILWGVALVALSHSTAQASVGVHSQSLRRLPTRKVRGSRRDLEIGVVVDSAPEDFFKSGSKSKGADKTIREAPTKIIETVTRPAMVSNLEELNKHGIDITTSKTNKKPKGNEETRGNNETPKGDEAKLDGNKNENVVENGVEHFQAVEVEVYRREVPSFSIQFTVEDSSSGKPPNMADYNELSEVSEEYLDNFFRSVFEDVQVRHDGTILFVMVNEDDPFTVDFRMTLEFIIPGEVPTINFLLDRLQDGLERDTSQAFFISDLSTMSDTNPFSKTVSFAIVSRPPMSAAEMSGGRDGENTPQVSSMENANKQHILISFLAGMGCVVLVGAGLLWRKKKCNQNAVSDSDQTLSLFDKSNGKGKSTNAKSDGVYGADEETMSYLNSIRKRYKDHDESDNPSASISSRSNIAAVEQTGSNDDGEDSICDTVDTGSEHEKKEILDVDYLNLELNSSGVEDDLRSVY